MGPTPPPPSSSEVPRTSCFFPQIDPPGQHSSHRSLPWDLSRPRAASPQLANSRSGRRPAACGVSREGVKSREEGRTEEGERSRRGVRATVQVGRWGGAVGPVGPWAAWAVLLSHTHSDNIRIYTRKIPDIRYPANLISVLNIRYPKLYWISKKLSELISDPLGRTSGRKVSVPFSSLVKLGMKVEIVVIQGTIIFRGSRKELIILVVPNRKFSNLIVPRLPVVFSCSLILFNSVHIFS
jgi:hypothetical protein